MGGMQNPSSSLQISQPRLVLLESRPPPPLLPLPLTKSTASSPACMAGRRPVNAKSGKYLSSEMTQQMISAADEGVGEEAEAHSISPACMGGRRPVNAKSGKFLSSEMQQQMISAADEGIGEEAEAHSIFLASPHPSSLPLPKFSVQRSCKVVESLDGIDARATDNLRRLLRLR